MPRHWIVPYEITTRGETEVEAETAEEARACVDRGEFEAHPGEEWVNWGSTGRARENV